MVGVFLTRSVVVTVEWSSGYGVGFALVWASWILVWTYLPAARGAATVLMPRVGGWG